MIYRNEDGRYPSVLVEDGETVTISARNAHEAGIPILKMRPRTTAALLVLAGQPLSTAPRLSDRGAFEQIEETENFVNLSEFDQDGRLAGYSVPFIRGVLEALDPNESTPSRSVKRLIPIVNEDHDCGCRRNRRLRQYARETINTTGSYDAALGQALPPTMVTHSVREAFVPDFLVDLNVFSLCTALGDIVVGRNATLILDSDINFTMVNNFLAYRGSQIVQRAPYLNVDIIGTMRGGVLDIFHSVTDVLKVDWHALTAEPSTKP